MTTPDALKLAAKLDNDTSGLHYLIGVAACLRQQHAALESLWAEVESLRAGRAVPEGWYEGHPPSAAPTPPQAEQAGKGVPVGVTVPMPGSPGFTMACFHHEKVPAGTKLYTHPAPALEQKARE